MKTMNICWAGLGILVCGAGGASAATHPRGLDMRVGAPPEHHGLGAPGTATTSWIERTVSFGAPGRIRARGFVDSEPGGDFLELVVDGETKAKMAGPHRVGQLIADVEAGPHVIRFQYEKNGSVDSGLDTAWVDDVELLENGVVFEAHTFSEATPAEIPGWTRGGVGGGWVATAGPLARQLVSPRLMRDRGDAEPISAGVWRQMSWPAPTGNELRVGYVVDSETEHDVFRILVDGVEAFRDSGSWHTGLARIPVTAGTHHIELEYQKNASVDSGRDEVRVLAVEAITMGIPFLEGGLSGAVLDEPLAGWTATDPELSWLVKPALVPELYVRQDEVPRQVDGRLGRLEYENTPRLGLLERTGTVAHETELTLSARVSGELGIGLELPDELGAWVANSGTITFYVDAAGPERQGRTDCGPGSTAPGEYVRRLELGWTGEGDAVTIQQAIGTCDEGAPYQIVTDAAELWSIEAVMRQVNPDDVASDARSLIIELEMMPLRPAGVALSDPLGFAMVVDALVPESGIQAVAMLPFRENAVFDPADVSRWEELRFTARELPSRYGVVVDAVPRSPVDDDDDEDDEG